MENLSNEQLGRLLFKSKHEPRKNQKKFLKDCGGTGTADELDAVLEIASQSKTAIAECKRIERNREISAKTIDAGVSSEVAEMLADVKLKMDEMDITQEILAEKLGWSQPQLSMYLTGTRQPGIENLTKLASALNCRWRLTSD